MNNKIWKSFFAVVICIIFVLIMASCDEKQDSNEPDGTAALTHRAETVTSESATAAKNTDEGEIVTPPPAETLLLLVITSTTCESGNIQI